MSDTSSNGPLSDFELSFNRDLPELEDNIQSAWLIKDLMRREFHNLYVGFNSIGFNRI